MTVEEWLTNYAGRNHTEATIKRYNRALEKCEEWSADLKMTDLHPTGCNEMMGIDNEGRPAWKQ